MIRDLGVAAAVIIVAGVAGGQYLGQKSVSVPQTETAETSAEPASKAAPKAAKPIAAQSGQTSGSGRSVSLASDGRGHFLAELEANGVRFPALVDTGASVVALPLSLAERLGMFPGPSAFTATVSTANGDVKVAPVVLRELRLAGIEIRNVEAVIIPDSSLRNVLLGMSFLRRLKSFSVKEDTLTLVD
jgi:aspartyl protease family protein